MTLARELRSGREKRHKHGIDCPAVNQELSSSSPFLDHAACAHDLEHWLVDSHGSGGDLAASGIVEKKLTGALPPFEAVPKPARSGLANHYGEFRDLVRSVNRCRDVTDMAEGRIVGNDGPEIVGRIGKAVGVDTAGVERVRAMPLFAVLDGLLVVQPPDVAFGQKFVVERPQFETLAGQDWAFCHDDRLSQESGFVPRFFGDDARSDGCAGLLQSVLGQRITQLLEAEDICSRDRSGAALVNSGSKVLECANAAASDDRNRHAAGYLAQQVDIVSRSHAVTVDRIDENLSGATRICLGCPVTCESSGRSAAAIDHHFVGAVAPFFRVDRDDNGLRAVMVRRFRDEGRPVECRAVDDNAVGTRFKMKMDVFDRANSAADGQGRKTIPSDVGQGVEQSTSARGTMHVEIDDLIDIPCLVSLELLKRVAQSIVTDELLAAIDGAVIVKQHRNNTMIKHDGPIIGKVATLH